MGDTTNERFTPIMAADGSVAAAGGLSGLKNIAADAPKYVALCQRLLGDNRVPASAKAVLLGAGAFAVSPVNIPFFIPVIGVLDDIGIALLAWGYFIKKVPASVLAEHKAVVGLGPTLVSP
jgi:uncharacterized membrane protein YkvA (DUF1232 family)